MTESHDEKLKRIVEKAERHKQNYNDSKDFCGLDDILTLLDAGARCINLNAPQSGSGYVVHEVQYKGFLFVSASDTPVKEFGKYLIKCN